MRINLRQTAKFLKKSDNILILTHIHPDGDTLGCAFALCRALRKIGKNSSVICDDEIAPKYSFMWNGMHEQMFEPQIIVAVDVADSKLLGKNFEAQYKDKIDLCIDHHGSNTMYAKNTFLDTAAAASELVLEIIRQLHIDIDRQMADCIYTGLATDTGCFRYSNTTSRTLRMAADMIDNGTDYSAINTAMFETKTKTYAALERLALDSLKMYFDEQCAIITITQDMYDESGSDNQEDELISALPRQIEGVKVGATLREKKDGNFKLSLRTRAPINASDICAKMGGGGHRRAAGCDIEGPIENATKVLLENIKTSLE